MSDLGRRRSWIEPSGGGDRRAVGRRVATRWEQCRLMYDPATAMSIDRASADLAPRLQELAAEGWSVENAYIEDETGIVIFVLRRRRQY